MSEKTKKRNTKKIIIISLITVVSLILGYCIMWTCLYHFQFKKHISSALTKDEDDETKYTAYYINDGFDRYTLFIPEFPELNMYYIMGSGLEMTDEGQRNPMGVDVDFSMMCHRHYLTYSFEECLFNIMPYVDMGNCIAGESYRIKVDENGELDESDKKLTDEGRYLYDKYQDEIKNILNKANDYFNF
ncbi:MAG: hypothetical protein GX638_03705 [Crenarchaeota archaeon]|nr:hypothetical protein [Thermoproteota archaeon]